MTARRAGWCRPSRRRRRKRPRSRITDSAAAAEILSRTRIPGTHMKKSASLRGFSAYRIWTQLPSIEISYLPDLLMFGAAIALVLWRAGGGADMAGPVHSGGRNLAQSAGAAGLCGIFAAAHHDRLCAEPGLHAGLWIRRGLQPAGRALHDSAARCAAVDSGAEFSSRRDAGDGGVVSRAAVGR